MAHNRLSILHVYIFPVPWLHSPGASGGASLATIAPTSNILQLYTRYTNRGTPSTCCSHWRGLAPRGSTSTSSRYQGWLVVSLNSMYCLDGVHCLLNLMHRHLRILHEKSVPLGAREVYRWATYGQTWTRKGRPQTASEAARRVDLDALSSPSAYTCTALVTHSRLWHMHNMFVH